MIGCGIGPVFNNSAWSPGGLPGLLGYWAADQSVLDGVADADPVGSMAGISPTSVTLTEATNKPVLKIGAGPTGRNVLRFDAASTQKLTDSTVIGQALSGSGVPWSMTWVAKMTGVASHTVQGIGHHTATQKGYFFVRQNIGTPLCTIYHNNDANTGTNALEYGLLIDAYWHVATIVYDGSTVSFYIDGVLQDVPRAYGSGATTLDRFSLGVVYAAGVLSHYATMDWAASVVNSVALSSAQVARLHAYLAARYMGVALNSYIVYDEFTTADDNPITSPRLAEPGRGVWTSADAGGKLSIAGGKLVVAGGTSFTNPHTYGTQRPGALGLMMKTGFYLPAPNVAQGFWAGLMSNVAAANNGAGCVALTNIIRGGENGATIYEGRTIGPTTDVWVDPKYFETAVIARGATGAWCLVRRPGMRKWLLDWVDYTCNLTSCYPRMLSTGQVVSVERTQVLLDGVTVPTAVGYSASLAAGVTIAAHVDGLVYATFVAATGVTKRLYVRYTDADNCLVIECAQAGSTLKIIERSGGVETEMKSKSQTWTNGTSYRIAVTLEWQTVCVSVNAVGGTGSACKSTLNLGTVPTTSTLVCGSHDMTEVTAWPLYHDAGDGMCAIPRGIFACGDSITKGEVDTADAGGTDYSPYPIWQCGYAQRLCALLGAEESPKRYAIGGYTVHAQLADIGISLNGFLGTPSDVVTMHGSNEMASMPTAADFKSDYLALIAAWHRKWPDATIWVMKPWRRGKAAETALIASWVDAIVADPSCSAFTRVGADCSLFIPGTDDGATNTFDGVHPNRAGHILLAAAQAALMA